jgi:hypothetical protein
MTTVRPPAPKRGALPERMLRDPDDDPANGPAERGGNMGTGPGSRYRRISADERDDDV